MRRIIRALLHGFGIREVLEAEDGAAGLEVFAAQTPDIVITDWEMPILDGLEMVRIIRQPDSSKNPYVPIIMITGHAEKRRVLQARDTGISEFLVKPISTKLLYDRVISAAFYPRPFIESPTYFGPDRRIVQGKPGAEGERRKDAEQIDFNQPIAATA